LKKGVFHFRHSGLDPESPQISEVWEIPGQARDDVSTAFETRQIFEDSTTDETSGETPIYLLEKEPASEPTNDAAENETAKDSIQAETPSQPQASPPTTQPPTTQQPSTPPQLPEIPQIQTINRNLKYPAGSRVTLQQFIQDIGITMQYQQGRNIEVTVLHFDRVDFDVPNQYSAVVQVKEHGVLLIQLIIIVDAV